MIINAAHVKATKSIVIDTPQTIPIPVTLPIPIQERIRTGNGKIGINITAAHENKII